MKDCTCSIVGTDEDQQIKYCPVHSMAFELFMAVKNWREAWHGSGSIPAATQEMDHVVKMVDRIELETLPADKK